MTLVGFVIPAGESVGKMNSNVVRPSVGALPHGVVENGAAGRPLLP